MNFFSSKNTYILAITLFFCFSINVYAQDAGLPRASVNTDGSLRAIVITEQEQRQALNDLNNQNQKGASSTSQNAASNYFACMAGSGLTNAVKGVITELAGFVTGGNTVPTNNPSQDSKNTGSILTGGVSWDQMGWCIANSLIEEIGRATVNWINTGFEGNPVFVDDPAQFFSDIADVQAGVFLNEITGGLLCTPIQNIVRVNLLQSYNNSLVGFNDQQCTFSNNSLTQFMDGETFSWQDWFNYTQNPYNNPYGATIYGQIALNERIATALNLQKTQLDWGAGFFSKVDPETGKITSPGSVIETQVNETLFSGKRRLEIADEFDEVVNALVNQLIRVAITELTEPR